MSLESLISEIEYACDEVRNAFDGVVDSDGENEDRLRLTEAINDLLELKQRLFEEYE